MERRDPRPSPPPRAPPAPGAARPPCPCAPGGRPPAPPPRLIGVATEELAGRLGSAAGGLLNATFGNATELIIAIVALQAGLYDLVKASLVGSILGNVLAVVGLAFFVGGITRERQRFDRTAAGAAGTQLALAATALLVPTVLDVTTHMRPAAMEGLSVGTAVVLLLAYGAGLVFSLRTP